MEISRTHSQPTHVETIPNRFIPKFFKKVSILALGTLAIYAAANLPVADAGVQAYLACIQMCTGGAGLNWITAIVCPTICAPFLLAPG